MIQLLDLEGSSEDTPRRRKWISEESKHDVLKDNNVKRHDNHNEDDDNISSRSHHSNTSHLSSKSEKHDVNSSESEKVSNDPTLSWFAGACHVWQSTEDEQEERIEYGTDNKSKEKSKGLWNKLSSANFFGGFAGLNIYKNFDTKSKITQKDKSKYFWNLQNKKPCDCKKVLRSESTGGIFGWANIGFSDESSNKSSTQSTPVVDLRKENQHFGEYCLCC